MTVENLIFLTFVALFVWAFVVLLCILADRRGGPRGDRDSLLASVADFLRDVLIFSSLSSHDSDDGDGCD
jgi:hypothetical protein